MIDKKNIQALLQANINAMNEHEMFSRYYYFFKGRVRLLEELLWDLGALNSIEELYNEKI